MRNPQSALHNQVSAAPQEGHTFQPGRTSRPQVGHLRVGVVIASAGDAGAVAAGGWEPLDNDFNSAANPPPAISTTISTGSPITTRPISSMKSNPTPILILAPPRSAECAPAWLPIRSLWLPVACAGQRA